jgi:AraC-like DNA-binding protein
LHSRFERTGQTFSSWLLEKRLDECCRALRDPSQVGRNISEIAYSCGFNDLSYFNKAFRTRFGMPPREWRYVFMTRH